MAFWSGWWSNLFGSGKASKISAQETELLNNLELLLEREFEQEEELQEAFKKVKNETEDNKRAILYLDFRKDLNKFEELEETIVAVDEKLAKIMTARLKNMHS